MDYPAQRARLVALLSNKIRDRRVLETLAQIPRELFIPARERRHAYEDRPLPIGLGQTISQPLIVALMTQALGLTGTEKVLEIGTGSGYQTAILAGLARSVVTTERLSELSQTARETLTNLGYSNISFHLSGEPLGRPEDAPYDAVIVTAAAPRVPPELVAQLVLGGRMVIPVGSLYRQELCKITRREDSNLVEKLGGCSFVSLIGKGAWTEGR